MQIIYCNVGTIGHVAHGKSTVVKAISGVHVSDKLFRFRHGDRESFLIP